MAVWKLGLDLGTNSIGWCAFTFSEGHDPDWSDWRLADAGVRIIPDGREPAADGRVGESLAVNRRQARGMRRNRDHGNNRIKALAKALIDYGLLPVESSQRSALLTESPYQLRALAVTTGHPLTAHQLGRVLLHLGVRRGFLSNRKTDKADDDATVFKQKISQLHRALQYRVLTSADLDAIPEDSPLAQTPWTLGEFLWHREQAGLMIRFRGEQGDLYPDRAMYRAEFDRIRAVQAPFHPSLTAADWERLRDNHILFQHPLRPVERGACSFYPQHPRTFRDTPIAQQFRISKELSILRVIMPDQSSHRLTAGQYRAIADVLGRQEKATFAGIRKLKGTDGTPLFPKESRFNIEDDRRKHLEGNRVVTALRKSSKANILMPLWDTLPDNVLNDIFERLHNPVDNGRIMDDVALVGSLVRDFGLTNAAAHALMELPLGALTTSYSRQAMEDLLPIMSTQGLDEYDAAVELLGEDEAKRRLAGFQASETLYERLPYYGEVLRGSLLGADPRKPEDSDPEGHYGKIGNPTVHIALNQVRKLVNELIDRFGEPPATIQVELSRDLKLPKVKREAISSQIAKNEKANKNRAEHWKTMTNGAEPTAADLRKIKLWEELARDEVARRCVFTGRVISAQHLVNGEVEVEHLLPRSRTLDDGMNNLTLSFRNANRLKGNRTPYEAFGHNQHAEQGIVWAEVLERAKGLSPAKAARFGASAMDDWEVGTDFIARQMTDTAFISRAARRYLTAVCEDVMPAPGRLTAMIRSQWRLNGLLSDDNQKNRNDHRHHTVDAFVIGLANRSMLQRVSSAMSHDREQVRLPDLPDPLRQALRDRLNSLAVSFKPDHGGSGAMFKKTAYGFVKTPDGHKPDYNLVTRKRLDDLSLDELDVIRDGQWRAQVREYLEANAQKPLSNDTERRRLLAEFGQKHGVHSIRILVKDQSVEPVKSAPYKGYAKGSYACCDVWSLPDGEPGNWKAGSFKWKGKFWSYGECSKGLPPSVTSGKPHPAAKFITRLFKDDVIALSEGGRDVLYRVVKLLASSKRIHMQPIVIAKSNGRSVTINELQKHHFRKASISPSGVVQVPS